ncbi:MAG: hypothetical protein K6V97_06945 [Actinomycetia bacterium]|nr:hypothetical protein [Actinomycetes bacterium]
MNREGWPAWLPADFGTLWLVFPERNRLWEQVARLGLFAGHATQVVGPVPPGTLDGSDPACARLRAAARYAGADAAYLAGRAEAQDLVLWSAGSPSEEAAWSDLYRLLDQKGCYVLHWIVPDPTVAARYRDYLVRPDPDGRHRLVLDWDPDLFA